VLQESSDELARLPLAGPCGLAFCHQVDRLGHNITGPAGAAVMLQSFEHAEVAEGGGLASPVFQEVHTEELPQGPALMTVGQWGKIHFSGVFLKTASGVVECDLAARVRQSGPVQLASTYTVAATFSDLIAADEQSVVCRIPQTDMVLRITAGHRARLVLAEAGRAALRLQVMPWPPEVGQASLPQARTVQWNYTLALVNAADLV